MSLVKPDAKRCQAVITPEHGAFRLGPPDKPYRCEYRPLVIATELKAGRDKKRGSMSLCGRCLKEFNQRMPGYAEIKKIKGRAYSDKESK